MAENISTTLTELGTGTGAFLDAVTPSIVYFFAVIGVVGAVIALITGVMAMAGKKIGK